ncbi:MAG: hypothetical protein D6795_20445 [Deltaproteobacteria bacterium]|nr:MAG: hypothetical protein D6795_20445 [Deltaproteobacteria bacterium]
MRYKILFSFLFLLFVGAFWGAFSGWGAHAIGPKAHRVRSIRIFSPGTGLRYSTGGGIYRGK